MAITKVSGEVLEKNQRDRSHKMKDLCAMPGV